ncbi:MAG: zinc ribbon domain-containing protein [Deltaproteobacteria bacterium]|nr:zinc ribbon domain-containing protein [Deltaproteobacteria bacterium]
MPIYEYTCKACGEVNEFLTTMGNDGAGLTCKACGKDALEKMLSITNVGSAQKEAVAPACGSGCSQQAPPCGSGCCGMCPD